MTKIKYYSEQGNLVPIILEDKLFEKVQKLSEADIVVLPGGGDWYPGLYNQTTDQSTYYNLGTDVSQLDLMLQAVKQEKFIFGICRGAQGLCIANNGALFQDVEGHSNGKNHLIYKEGDSKETYVVNSLHHQMLDVRDLTPYVDYDLLYYSNVATFIKGLDTRMVSYKEPEIIVFKTVDGIGVQGHPEMRSFGKDASAILYDNLIVYLKLFNKKKNTFLFKTRKDLNITNIEHLIDIVKRASGVTTTRKVTKIIDIDETYDEVYAYYNNMANTNKKQTNQEVIENDDNFFTKAL
jgi:gamma-glutamyl-gamma-aminobutyrate hydrolase PuuD